MKNKVYWDALIERYENMSDEEFYSIVVNLDKKNDIPFKIIEDFSVYYSVAVPFNTQLKPDVWYNINEEYGFEYKEDMDLIAC